LQTSSQISAEIIVTFSSPDAATLANGLRIRPTFWKAVADLNPAAAFSCRAGDGHLPLAN
jgi:hypothetical protein